MTYVISDIHGRYDLYMAMLDEIGFSDTDTLYILGDVVDRGRHGLKTVLDIAERKNVIPLMGNHDYLALTILSCLDKGVRPGQLEDMRSLIDAWKNDGGMETYREYKSLSEKERRLALMTLDSFRNYVEVRVGDREFVLCHGGIRNYKNDKSLAEYTLYDFAFVREDYSKQKFTKTGKFLVTGHTPTAAIDGATEGKIYKTLDHIAIDCGAVFGYSLGCLCLDTMEEFYVTA